MSFVRAEWSAQFESDWCDMRTLRPTFFAICGVISLVPTGAMAFDPRAPELQTLRAFRNLSGVVRLHDRSDIAAPQPYWVGQCRISGARAQKIERRTSDPCLAADAAPGNVCFERLGQDTSADAPVTLDLGDTPCGP
jgi:hypothetical protein